MKNRIFCPLLIVGIFVSCVDEFSSGVKLSSNALVFDASQMRVMDSLGTKAGPVSGTTFPTDLSMCLTSYSSTTGSTFFNDIPFTYNSEAGGWKATNGKYWPQTGTLDFIAYSCPGLSPAVTYASPNATTGITSFVTGDNRTVQADLMFGGAENCSYSPSSKPTFSFKHALSLVTFTAACPDMAYDSSTNTGVTIESITLATANYGGTCAVSRSGNTISGISWTSLANNYNGNPVPGISSQGLTTAQVPVGAGVLLPPQNAVNFTINYTVHSGPGVNSSKSYTYSNSGTWTMANRYVYAIEISIGNEVVVSAQVTDWASPAMNWFYAEGKRIVHQGTDFTLASGQPVYWRNSSSDGYEKLTYVSGSYGSSVKYEASTHYVTVTRGSDYYSISLERKFSTFAGIMIAPAPLYYNGTNFEIREEDDWSSNSYGGAHGLQAGSYNFTKAQLGKYFDSRGASYDGNTSINNFGNKITYDRYNDWRVPREDEWVAILGTTRPGSTVNGTPNVHWAWAAIPDGSDDGNTQLYGVLLFPDNKTISVSNRYDQEWIYDGANTNYNFVSPDNINSAIRQGCVFIAGHLTCRGSGSWQTGASNYSYHLAGYSLSNGYTAMPGCIPGFNYHGTIEYCPVDEEVQSILVRYPHQVEYSEFAGLYIARAPLYQPYSGSVKIVNDNWDYDTYGNGNSTGYYLGYNNLGKYFDSRGSSFNYNSMEIDNNGNRVSVDGINNWRLPTASEWEAIIGTTRPGSNVNGVASRHYAFVQLTGSEVYHAGYAQPYGLLLFPDGKTITGKAFSGTDNTTVTRYFNWEELNNYIVQGCVFLPCSGSASGDSYPRNFSNGGIDGYYISSNKYGNISSYNISALYVRSSQLRVFSAAGYSWYSVRLVSPSFDFSISLTDGESSIINRAFATARDGVVTEVSDSCTWTINSDGHIQASYVYGGQTYTATDPNHISTYLQSNHSLFTPYAVIDGYNTSNMIARNKSYPVYYAVPLANGGTKYLQQDMTLSSSNTSSVTINGYSVNSTSNDGSSTITAYCNGVAMSNTISLSVRNLTYELHVYGVTYVSEWAWRQCFTRDDESLPWNISYSDFAGETIHMTEDQDGYRWDFGLVFYIYLDGSLYDRYILDPRGEAAYDYFVEVEETHWTAPKFTGSYDDGWNTSGGYTRGGLSITVMIPWTYYSDEYTTYNCKYTYRGDTYHTGNFYLKAD